MNKPPAKHAAPQFGRQNAYTIMARRAKRRRSSPGRHPHHGMISFMPDILAATGNPWVGTVQLGLCLLATVAAIWVFFWGLTR